MWSGQLPVVIFGVEPSYYFLCAVGSFVLFFKINNNGGEVFNVIGYFNKEWKDKPLCRVLEAVIFTVLGSLIAAVITQPTNPQQAIAAGLGWTGLISKLGK